MIEDEPDNILEALLNQNMDNHTLKYMGYYIQYLDHTLFLKGLQNNNKDFIKDSLLSGAFERHIFKDPKVVEEIVKFMDQGSKTNQMLNTLILIDIEVWNNE